MHARLDYPEGKEMTYRAIIGTAVMALSVGAMAADAPIATAAPAKAEQAPLGRLFFTPERRVALERQRLSNIQDRQTLQGATMTLDGVVQRSSGKSTVWINGRPQNENDAARTGVSATVSAKTPGSAMLAPGEEAPSQLKVGEAMNRATGERDNRLGGGVVAGSRTKPAPR
jgi:hypothetical protein